MATLLGPIKKIAPTLEVGIHINHHHQLEQQELEW